MEAVRLTRPALQTALPVVSGHHASTSRRPARLRVVDSPICGAGSPSWVPCLLPFDLPPGRHSPIGARFTLLRAPSPGVAGPVELAYLEGQGEIRYLDDKKTLAAYDTAWARLTAAALSFSDSRKFMAQVLDDFRQLAASG